MMRWLARLVALRGWRADLAALLLGMLSASALPPLHVIPILLIAVPGLIALIDGTRGAGGAFRRGLVFGVGHHVIGLYWITEAILFEAARFWWLVPLAVPALSAVLALFIGAATALARKAAPGQPRALALAGGWVLADIARAFVGTGFPWNPWGSIWAIPGVLGDVMIQPAAWIGVHGLTLVTILLAATPSLGRRAWLSGGAVLAAWALLGIARLPVEVTPSVADAGTRIVLVQGNVAQGQKWDNALLRSIWDRYLRLTREGVARAGGQPVVVVWPETSSPVYPLEGMVRARVAIDQAAALAPDQVAGFLIGSVGFSKTEQPRNSLVAFAPPSAMVLGTYDKWHLVPFGEFQPSWFPLPIQVVPGRGFAPGSGPKTLNLPGLPSVGPMICYEAVYSGELVDERDRPAWLVNITNDAWFGVSTGPRQHLAAARMRAVEEGLPLMRAANTGISAAFDAYGRELGRLGLSKEGSLTVPLPPALGMTPYARLGLWMPGALGTMAIALAFTLSRKRVLAVD